ncbi:protein MIS12 homolog [Dioscorea cayenensis subsp. rotundata]|uniref:Protein MIS12 homolog n=1 Tax=Dioscorea cayennensis subsp. rotundata TaxID=55577 RepID=A0AB40CCT1_DIOCR|nr:protein MIS12 homolog [Dioscorea cayenensis subsp. rotundata]
MEGSESEAVFDACDLNPQRFINEVLNASDDLLDGAFQFCLQQASIITGCGEKQSDELAKGVSYLRNMTQGILDKRMNIWEKYCLRHCFSVPEGFLLQKTQDLSVENLSLQEGGSEAELDSQLSSLREKLAAVGKESSELHREIQALEKQASLNNSYDASIAEALQLYEPNSTHEMFQEVRKVASVLQAKAETMQIKRAKDMEPLIAGKINSPSKRQHVFDNHDLTASLE